MMHLAAERLYSLFGLKKNFKYFVSQVIENIMSIKRKPPEI